MGGQRQAVSTCANDGNLIIAGIHLFFHCGKGIKPGIIPGFLPGKALHCRDDGQGGQFRQSVYPAGGVGEQLPALLVLGADGIRKGVYHQHMLSGQCGAPGVGIIIWFQRAQLGKAGAVAAVDYLPLGPHIPQRQQVRPLSAGSIQLAEAVQRFIIGGKHTGQGVDLTPGFLGIFPGQIFGHGAHLGCTAAAEQKWLPGADGIGSSRIALFRGQNDQAAVFPPEAQPFIGIAQYLQQGSIIIHGGFLLVCPAWLGRFRRCLPTGNVHSRGAGQRGRRPGPPLLSGWPQQTGQGYRQNSRWCRAL